MNIRDLADECHRTHKAETPQLAFCRKCGKRYFVAYTVFIQEKGRCTCSWACCSEAKPGNQKHERHMAYRDATYDDQDDAACGIIADFRDGDNPKFARR